MSPAQILALTYIGYHREGDVTTMMAKVKAGCPEGWSATYTVGCRSPAPGAILVGGLAGTHHDDDFHIWVVHNHAET